MNEMEMGGVLHFYRLFTSVKSNLVRQPTSRLSDQVNMQDPKISNKCHLGRQLW